MNQTGRHHPADDAIGASVALRIADDTRDGRPARRPGSMDRLCGASRAEPGGSGDAAAARREERRDNGMRPGRPAGRRLRLARPDGDLASCSYSSGVAGPGGPGQRPLYLPPLRESLDDLRMSLSTWRLWCVRRHAASSQRPRPRAVRDGLIGRLMVAPDQRPGIGAGCSPTSRTRPPSRPTPACSPATAPRNITMYERAGYTRTGSPVPRTAASTSPSHDSHC